MLIALGLGALATALPAFAQQRDRIRRIGFLYFGTRESAVDSGRYRAFLDGMRELGYVEGKNFTIEARFADGKAEPLPSLVTELIRSKPEVIVATGTPVYAALKQSTNTIPVVITVTADPVFDGFAASLARPGGNFTGLSTGNVELYPKQIELLKAAVPNLSHVALLWNPNNPGHPARLKAMLVSTICRVDSGDGRVNAVNKIRTRKMKFFLRDSLAFVFQQKFGGIAKEFFDLCAHSPNSIPFQCSCSFNAQHKTIH